MRVKKNKKKKKIPTGEQHHCVDDRLRYDLN